MVGWFEICLIFEKIPKKIPGKFLEKILWKKIPPL
jgi:hypothetical protein